MGERRESDASLLARGRYLAALESGARAKRS
jgi:hypothetical protein